MRRIADLAGITGVVRNSTFTPLLLPTHRVYPPRLQWHHVSTHSRTSSGALGRRFFRRCRRSRHRIHTAGIGRRTSHCIQASTNRTRRSSSLCCSPTSHSAAAAVPLGGNAARSQWAYFGVPRESLRRYSQSWRSSFAFSVATAQRSPHPLLPPHACALTTPAPSRPCRHGCSGLNCTGQHHTSSSQQPRQLPPTPRHRTCPTTPAATAPTVDSPQTKDELCLRFR